MKKIIATLLASTIAASTMMPVMAKNTFSDVTDKHWAKEYVEDMAKKGLISGYDDGTFKPEKDVSRMDAFALFARLMGSNSDANKDVVEIAKEKYKNILKGYDLTYAEGDIAFLLYREVITEEELDTYFKGAKKTEAMPRYEAAILITKALRQENVATDEVLMDMEYDDVKEIPADAKQYVYYVSKKGIMQGSENKFAPKEKVQRGQIAVMLSKTDASANYDFEVAKIERVDIAKDNIKIADLDEQIGYSKDTVIFRDGSKVLEKELLPGQTVVLTYAEDDKDAKVVYIDILASDVTSRKKVIYKGYISNEGKLQVTAEDSVTHETTLYECSANAIIKSEDKYVDINKIKSGEYVELGFAGDIIIEITAAPKSETIKDATLASVDPRGIIKISHEDEAYDGLEFEITKDTVIVKDGDTAEFADLYRGDSLTVRLDYGVLASIISNASRKKITGVLKEYTISKTPSLTIRVDGKDETYDIPAGIVILKNGKEARLADFDIDSGITISVESEAIVKLESESNIGSVGARLSGKVVSVSEAANVIVISYMSGETEVTTYITCKNTTKFIAMPSFSDYSLKKIKVGDTVEVYGEYQNGIFVSQGVTVMPAE